jgi:hypothetical protein
MPLISGFWSFSLVNVMSSLPSEIVTGTVFTRA